MRLGTSAVHRWNECKRGIGPDPSAGVVFNVRGSMLSRPSSSRIFVKKERRKRQPVVISPTSCSLSSTAYIVLQSRCREPTLHPGYRSINLQSPASIPLIAMSCNKAHHALGGLSNGSRSPSAPSPLAKGFTRIAALTSASHFRSSR